MTKKEATSSSGPSQSTTTSRGEAQPASKTQLRNPFTQQHLETGIQFLSAYAKTWIGMSPIWLMGEAIFPGQKVGNQFKQGTSELRVAAEELREALATSVKDIIVIVDEQLRNSTSETTKMTEVLKASGENAIVVVTRSLQKAESQIKSSSPKIKRSVAKNGKDVVVLVDKALKNPIVVTGISKLARSRGIPYSEAILQIATLGLAKLIEAIPDVLPEDGLDADDIVEVDAAEFERRSSDADRQEAQRIGRGASGPPPKVKRSSDKSACTIY